MKKKLTKLLLTTLFCTSSFIFTSLESRANLFNSILGNWCAVEINTAFFGKQLIQENDPIQLCLEFLRDGNVILTSSLQDGIFPYKKLDKNRIVVYAARSMLITFDSKKEQLLMPTPNTITGGKAEMIFVRESFIKERKKVELEKEKAELDRVKNKVIAEKYFEDGKLYYEEYKFKDAINMFTNAISINSNNSFYYWWRGKAKSKLIDQKNMLKQQITNKDYESVCKDWRKASSLGNSQATKQLQENCS